MADAVNSGRVEKIVADMNHIWSKLGNSTIDVPLNDEQELGLLLSRYDTKKYSLVTPSGVDPQNGEYVLVFRRIQNA